MKITKCKYKGIDALKLDCGKTVFTVIPESGMKTASIVDKKSGFEFLHQNPKGLKKFMKPEYGGDFVEYECAGFDDMFPTIDPYFITDGPWKDINIPNHGEIWAEPYTVSKITDNAVTATVTGIRMPYTITKKFSSSEPSKLRIDYTLKNPTQYTMKYIWAAHVMLNAQVGSKFIVPDECNKGICMFSNNERIGEYGDKFDFPINTDKNGVTHDMTVMRDGKVDADEKYYLANKLTKNGFLGVTYPENNKKFLMKFPVKQVPYVGIMNDECGWDGMYLCILEPCTSPYDRPDIAELHNCCAEIAPNSEIKWYLEIEVADNN